MQNSAKSAKKVSTVNAPNPVLDTTPTDASKSNLHTELALNAERVTVGSTGAIRRLVETARDLRRAEKLCVSLEKPFAEWLKESTPLRIEYANKIMKAAQIYGGFADNKKAEALDIHMGAFLTLACASEGTVESLMRAVGAGEEFKCKEILVSVRTSATEIDESVIFEIIALDLLRAHGRTLELEEKLEASNKRFEDLKLELRAGRELVDKLHHERDEMQVDLDWAKAREMKAVEDRAEHVNVNPEKFEQLRNDIEESEQTLTQLRRDTETEKRRLTAHKSRADKADRSGAAPKG